MDKGTIYVDAVTHYGEAHQVMKAVEEMSELTKELCKFSEGLIRGTYVNNTEMRDRVKCLITGEMADVEIMLRQLVLIFDNEKAMNAAIDEKLARLRMRMGG